MSTSISAGIRGPSLFHNFLTVSLFPCFSVLCFLFLVLVIIIQDNTVRLIFVVILNYVDTCMQ